MTTILVLGATGLLGRPAAARLNADGFDVRALARNPDRARTLLGPDIDIVPGDVTDPDSLAAAVDGCHAVHISVSGPAELPAAQNTAALAAGHGVRRISYLSGATVSPETGWFPMVAAKLAAEAALNSSGVATTVLCPSWPFEQLPRFIRDGRATVIGAQPTPLHWFAADDLARMISTAHRRPEAADTRLYVHGPEGITMPDALERYRAALRPDVPPVTILPLDVARQMAQQTADPVFGFITELMAYFDTAGEGNGDPARANDLLGAPTTTLDDWIAGVVSGTVAT